MLGQHMVNHDNLGMAVADPDEPARVREPEHGIVGPRLGQQGGDTMIGIGGGLAHPGSRRRRLRVPLRQPVSRKGQGRE